MSVVVTFLATPVPGKEAVGLRFINDRAAELRSLAPGAQVEVAVRFGGPIGQILLVGRHEDLKEPEGLMRGVITSQTAGGNIGASDERIFESVEQAVWIVD